MDVVTVRDLRNHGGEVLTRLAREEALIVTRDGAAFLPEEALISAVTLRPTLPP